MFKFELIYNGGHYFLENAPLGWDTRQPALDRNDTYMGIFTSYTVSLTFIFDGFNRLEEIYNNDGVQAHCIINFYEWDALTLDYVLQNSGVIDFKTRNVVSTVKGGGVEYSILDTEFKQKLKARENTLINYEHIIDLDGGKMGEPLYKNVEVLGVPIVDDDVDSTMELINYSDDGAKRNIIFAIDTPNYNSPRFQTVAIREYGGSALAGDIQQTDCFFLSDIGGALSFDYDLNFTISSDAVTVSDWETRIKILKAQFDQSGNVVLGTLETIAEFEKDTDGTFNFTGNTGVIVLGENEGVCLYGYHVNINLIGSSVDANLTINSAIINSNYSEQFEPTFTQATYLYEIFSRLKESMTGDNTPIDAPILNRPDTIDPQPEYGEYSLYSVFSGLMLRGFTTKESNLSFTYKGFYEDVDKILNIGLSVIDDVLYIRKKKDLFLPDLVHLFDENDTFSDSLSKSIALDWFYSDIDIGYAKSSYEEISGLLEYNNISSYSTFLSKIKNKLELISKLRADGYGMEFCRRMQKYSTEQKNTETQDSKYDEDKFILDTVFNDPNYLQRTFEGFSDVSGIDIITTPINLSITPANNVHKHGWLLKTGLQKYATNLIQFNRSQNPIELSTTTDAGKTVVDSTPISYTSMDIPIFAGTLIEVEVRASLSIYNKIKANPYGLIGVWNEVEDKYNYGWIKNFSLGSVDKATNLILIEAINAPDVLRSWLWNDATAILWNDEKAMELNN